jgi:ribosomal protein S1
MVVVSHVAFLEAIKPTVLNSVMNDDRETEYVGVVTLKKHDYLLITFNECLAGKLVYTDMDDETKDMFNNNRIEIEKTEIKFKIDDEQNGQLLLTQTWKTRQLWKENISKEFKVGMALDGVVLGTSKKFILVQLKYNAIGILPMTNLLKTGDHISVRISGLDIENRKIKLALC